MIISKINYVSNTNSYSHIDPLRKIWHKKCQKTRKITFYVHFTLCFYICNLHHRKYFYGDYVFTYVLFLCVE